MLFSAKVLSVAMPGQGRACMFSQLFSSCSTADSRGTALKPTVSTPLLHHHHQPQQQGVGVEPRVRYGVTAKDVLLPADADEAALHLTLRLHVWDLVCEPCQLPRVHELVSQTDVLVLPYQCQAGGPAATTVTDTLALPLAFARDIAAEAGARSRALPAVVMLVEVVAAGGATTSRGERGDEAVAVAVTRLRALFPAASVEYVRVAASAANYDAMLQRAANVFMATLSAEDVHVWHTRHTLQGLAAIPVPHSTWVSGTATSASRRQPRGLRRLIAALVCGGHSNAGGTDQALPSWVPLPPSNTPIRHRRIHGSSSCVVS